MFNRFMTVIALCTVCTAAWPANDVVAVESGFDKPADFLVTGELSDPTTGEVNSTFQKSGIVGFPVTMATKVEHSYVASIVRKTVFWFFTKYEPVLGKFHTGMSFDGVADETGVFSFTYRTCALRSFETFQNELGEIQLPELACSTIADSFKLDEVYSVPGIKLSFSTPYPSSVR